MTQPAAYRPPVPNLRWVPVRNESSETIPGWGVIALKADDPDQTDGDYFAGFEQGSQVVWRGHKPDADAEAAQNPAMLLFNSGTPIPPGRIGKATQDWPALVLHDGTEDSLVNGEPCGPMADSWFLWSGRSAFTCVSHDPAHAAGKGKIHTIFAAPHVGNVAHAWGGAGAVFSILDGAAAEWSEQTRLGGWTLESGGQRLRAGVSGLVLFAFSATLNSTAAEGSVLRLTMYRERDGARTQTALQAYRLQAIEDDAGYQSPFTTTENVAAQFPLEVEAGDVFTLENTGGVDLSATAALWSAVLIAPKRPAPRSADGFSFPA